MKKFLFLFFVLTPTVWPVTRFYLPATGAAPVNPQYGVGVWDDTLNSGGRFKMVTSLISSAMTSTTVNALAGATFELILVRQYVSDPLEWQLIAGTLKGQIRAAESNAGFNGTLYFHLFLATNSGVLKASIFETGTDATTTPPEFVVTTLTNRRFANAAEESLLTVPNVIAQQGDRLVLEVGVREITTVTARTGSLNFGDNSATDLAENQTTTAADNPWIEFSQTLNFYTDDGVSRDTLRPDANGADNNMNDSATALCGATASNWTRVDDTTTVGAAGNDLLEVDATVTKCNQGLLVRESHTIADYSTGFTTIDTVRWMVRARTTSGVGGDSLEPFMRLGTDTVFATREATGTTWGNFYTIARTRPPGSDPDDHWTDGTLDSLECGVRFKTTTAAAQQEYTEGKVIVVRDVPPSGPDPLQPAGPCNLDAGDTLYPVGAGFYTGFSNGCGGANNWQCVDDDLSGTCSVTDSVYWEGTVDEEDSYKLGTRTEGSSTRWGQRGNTQRVIDCLAVTA